MSRNPYEGGGPRRRGSLAFGLFGEEQFKEFVQTVVVFPGGSVERST